MRNRPIEISIALDGSHLELKEDDFDRESGRQGLQSALAVRGPGTVFALVVMLAYVCRDGACRTVERDRTESEPGDVFEDIGMLDGVGRIFAPGKGSVAGDEDSWDGDGIQTLGTEAADDNGTGISDVAGGDIFLGQGIGDGNRAVEIIGVGCPEAGNRKAGLSPGGSEFGMGVDHAADLGELAVEEGVSIEIAGRTKMAVDNPAFQIGHDEVGGGERSVINPAGLDDHQGLGS